MKRAAVCLLALSACWDFNDALSKCSDVGACRFTSDAGAEAGGGAGGGSALGGGAGGGGSVPDDGGAEFARSCNDDHWCFELPFPSLQFLYGAWTDGRVAWAVGDNQQIYRYSDGGFGDYSVWPGGNSLKAVAVEPTGRLTAVGDSAIFEGAPDALSETDMTGVIFRAVWAAADGGRVVVGERNGHGVIFEDLGAGWSAELGVDGGPLDAVAGSGWDDVWAVGLHGTLLRRAGAGSWAAIDAGLSSDWSATCVDGAGVRWLAGASPPTLAMFSGQTLLSAWSPSQASALGCIPTGPGAWGATRGTASLYVFGAPDAGMLVDTFADSIQALAAPGDNDVFVVGGLGNFMRGDRTHLTNIRQQFDDTIFGCARDPAGTLYASGGKSLLVRHTRAGWTRAGTPGGMADFNDVAFAPDGGGWLAADDGMHQLAPPFLRAAGTSLHLNAVTATPNGFVAAGVLGAISIAQPELWSDLQAAGTGQPSYKAITTAGDDAIAVGTDATVTRIRPDGGLASIDVGDAGTLFSIYAAGPDELFISFSDGVIRWKNGAVDSWPIGTNDVLALGGTGPTDVWAADRAGGVFHFNGTDWSGAGSVQADVVTCVDVTAATVHLFGQNYGTSVVYELARP